MFSEGVSLSFNAVLNIYCICSTSLLVGSHDSQLYASIGVIITSIHCHITFILIPFNFLSPVSDNTFCVVVVIYSLFPWGVPRGFLLSYIDSAEIFVFGYFFHDCVMYGNFVFRSWSDLHHHAFFFSELFTVFWLRGLLCLAFVVGLKGRGIWGTMAIICGMPSGHDSN